MINPINFHQNIKNNEEISTIKLEKSKNINNNPANPSARNKIGQAWHRIF